MTISWKMGSPSIAVFVCALAISLVGLGETSYSSEVDAKVFVKDASSRIYDGYNQFGDNYYNMTKNNIFEKLNKNIDSKDFVKELYVIGLKAEIFDKYNYNFKDTELKLALKNLRSYVFLFYSNAAFLQWHPLQVTTRNVKPFPNGVLESSDTKLAYYPDILRIFTESNYPEELEYYLEAWRETTVEWATTRIGFVLALFQVHAKKMLKFIGLKSDVPQLDLWNRCFYDHLDFSTKMETVMDEIKPFYQQLHAFIRSQLTQKYGANVVNATGLIPDHLFQQVLVQAWTNGSVIENAFPSSDRQFLPYDNFVREKILDAKKMMEIAENFHTSLGLDPMGEDFWENRAKVSGASDGENGGGYCRPFIFDSTPKAYIRYCEQVDFRKLIQAHGYMSRLHYAKAKEHLPAYFFSSYDLEYAVGEAVKLSASTPKHLSAIGMTSKDYQFSDDIQMNRLLRMGIDTVLNLPVFFVHAKVFINIINGTVDIDDIEEHYWSLMESYVGVERPSNINFPPMFFADLEEDHALRKFVSDVLGYQFYRALCKKSGHSGELHNCDFYNSKEAGTALKNMMSLGSSKSWRRVTRKLLPKSPAFSADGLLEFYAPLQDWLEDKNKKSNAQIGWDTSN